MNTRELIEYVHGISDTIPIVESFNDVDPYTYWNSKEVKYGSLIFAVKGYTRANRMIHYQVVLYYGDRVLADESNVNNIYTDAQSTINYIIKNIELADGTITVLEGSPSVTFFRQRFLDDLAGGYCNFTIETDDSIGACGYEHGDIYPPGYDTIIQRLKNIIDQLREENERLSQLTVTYMFDHCGSEDKVFYYDGSDGGDYSDIISQLPDGWTAYSISAKTFSIDAHPVSSTVTINGEERSSGRFEAGEHIMWTVTCDGYISQEGTYVMGEEDHTEVIDLLPRDAVTLLIVPTPEEATVKIMGEERDSITVEPGRVIVYEVSHPMYETYFSTIVLLYNTTLEITLTPKNYENEYLTIISLEDNNGIGFEAGWPDKDPTEDTYIEYSTNKSTWTEVKASERNSRDYFVTLNKGQQVYLRGSADHPTTTYGYAGHSVEDDSVRAAHFVSAKSISVAGHVMSLIYPSTFLEECDMEQSKEWWGTFDKLFAYSNIIEADKLVLDSMLLADSCYKNMFYYSGSLTKAPALPATNLYGPVQSRVPGDDCYMGMFEGCINLVYAPSTLPATTLTSNCYDSMFRQCRSLVNPPTLPATTLQSYCYRRMFEGCASLTTAPVLPAMVMAPNAYNQMFSGCTSLVNPPALPATSVSNHCYDQMFFGCVAMTSSPTLPATNVGEWITIGSGNVASVTKYCYSAMFQGCSSLVNAGAILATCSDGYSFMSMFKDCTSLRVAPAFAVRQGFQYCCYEMFSGCTSLTDISNISYLPPAQRNHPLNNTAACQSYCFYEMFKDCTSLTNASSLHTYNSEYLLRDSNPASGINPDVSGQQSACYKGMFSGCTSLTRGPKIYLGTGIGRGISAFKEMYKDCTSLVRTPDIYSTSQGQYPSSTMFESMFEGCTSLTSFGNIPSFNVMNGGCRRMFYGCTSLVDASPLGPFLGSRSASQTLDGNECCMQMFMRCTNLQIAPEINVIQLGNRSLAQMFDECSSLRDIKIYAYTGTDYVDENSATYMMTYGVPAFQGTFKKHPSAVWDEGTCGIPVGWTVTTY